MAEEGGGKIAVVEEQQDMGDGMQCSDHPFKKNPGGICAYCLQEKLGKLVSSSFAALLILGRSLSSSPSPSFRSDIVVGVYGGFNQSAASSSSTAKAAAEFHGRRTIIPFLFQKKSKKTGAPDCAALKRSKSTTSAPRRGSSLADAQQLFDKSPRRRRGGFWPFLYLSSSSSSSSSSKQIGCRNVDKGLGGSKSSNVEVANNGSSSPPGNEATEAERKVSRSRSVGCGSRSFSGDFFGRISNGFGDCTLRRVESQREAKPSKSSAERRQSNHQQYMKERVRCGGIFGGFMLTSSSSSSSSSTYWVCDETAAVSNKTTTPGDRPTAAGSLVVNGRSHHQRSSWGWAFSSPMRAFARPSSKRLEASTKNGTVSNLGAIPSLLAFQNGPVSYKLSQKIVPKFGSKIILKPPPLITSVRVGFRTPD